MNLSSEEVRSDRPGRDETKIVRRLATTAVTGMAVLSFLFGALSTYAAFFHGEPKLDIFVSSVGWVVRNSAPTIPDLQVIYEGEDLLKKGKRLLMYTLRIQNTGDVNLKPDDFHAKLPFGIKIAGAEILNAAVLDASNTPLKADSIPTTSPDRHHLTFSPMMIDEGDWFDISMLVLADPQEAPVVTAMGKISGISEISVIGGRDRLPQAEWSRGLSGISLVAAIVVLVVLFVVVLALGWLAEMIAEAVLRKYAPVLWASLPSRVKRRRREDQERSRPRDTGSK